MIKAVLFDLDGTLLDTLGDIRRHLNAALAEFSYPPVTEEQTRAYVGNGADMLVRRAMPEGAADFAECFADFSERFAQSDNALTHLYDGEEETLRALKARGVKLGVITNKPHGATLGCISRFFGEDLFDFVHGDDGNFPLKPDPSLARFAALTLRAAPGECLFVGDGETDVLTARRAGMRGLAVLWGYRTRAQLEEAGAREFLAKFPDLLSFAG